MLIVRTEIPQTQPSGYESPDPKVLTCRFELALRWIDRIEKDLIPRTETTSVALARWQLEIAGAPSGSSCGWMQCDGLIFRCRDK